MRPTEITKSYVITNYVEPARRKGETTLRVRVGKVHRELGWTNRTPSVFSTLSSKNFQEEAGVELIEKLGGPPSGGPSTTVQFVYRVLDQAQKQEATPKVVPNGAGLMALAGICKEVFQSFGGGEAYLKAERDWGSDPWERFAAEARKEGNTEDQS